MPGEGNAELDPQLAKLAAAAIADVAEANGGTVPSFRAAREQLKRSLGRRLEKDELAAANKLLTQLIHARLGTEDGDDRIGGLPQMRNPTPAAAHMRTGRGVLIFTAFSSNYAAGHVCAAVNSRYAALHGYGWLAEVLPHELMLDTIAPRGHCSWYKVHLINRLLADPVRSNSRCVGAAVL